VQNKMSALLVYMSNETLLYLFKYVMNMLNLIYALGFSLLGYLCGSLPFAIWITRLVKGVDVRDAGSGHATTTNTIRQAGFQYAPAAWIVPLAGAFAVVGHCWPVFAGFRGGMGLATANGSMMAAAPVAILIIYAALGIMTLVLRHSARASVVIGILFAPLLWLVGLRGPVLWIGASVGAVVAFRFLIDWNRKYRELWLDRKNIR
jgi:glycerol-3-phosphate acyltransferase PlsY